MSEISANVKDQASLPGGGRRAAAASDGQAQRLGNNTKSQAAFRATIDEKTGEYQRFTLDPVRREYVQEIDRDQAVRTARSARYAAQTSASKLLFNHVTPRGTQWRVTGCTRRKIGEDVAILYSASIKKAHFGGVMVCGSVWTCPPCAAKISERRKNEIKQATDLHKGAGGALYMIAYTFSHQRHDELDPMLKKFAKARKHMREQRGYKNLKIDLGYIGDIRTLEVTYGDANGYHPHEHDLWLTADSLTQKQRRKMLLVLFTLWSKACAAAGLAAPNRKNGVNIIECESAAEYMAKFGREPKWGVASELAKQHVKSGKLKSMTPFDLLRGYHDGQKRLGPLFIDFAKAFFGKRQIVWSDGLKKLFGIGELSDEEIAVQEEQDAVVLIRMDAFQWRTVLKQSYDVRALLLELAESGGYDAVRLYLDKITFWEVPF